MKTLRSPHQWLRLIALLINKEFDYNSKESKSEHSNSNESRISWLKNDDEITVVDFTHSSWFESSFDWSEGILSPNLRETKESKKTMKRWDMSNLNKGNIKLFSIDLSDSNDICEEMHNEDLVPVRKLDITIKERINIINQKDKQQNNPLSQERKFKYKLTQPIATERKRIQRIVKDSIGSVCNHKEELEEIKISFIDQSPSRPKKSKPSSTKIWMLSGDDQKERISITEWNRNQKVAPEWVPQYDQKRKVEPVKKQDYIPKEKSTVAKSEFSKTAYIPLSSYQSPISKCFKSNLKEDAKLNKEAQSPRTRNQTITVLSTNYHTWETRMKWESQLRNSRLHEMSPVCNVRSISEIDETSKIFYQTLSYK